MFLDVAAAGSAPLVCGSFPVADKHFRGSWLCQGPGLGIWRPPDTSGSREIHAPTVAADLATYAPSGALVQRISANGLCSGRLVGLSTGR